MEGVFVNDLLRDNMNAEFHIFGLWEVIVEVEVFDVRDETFSSWSGNDTVEENCFGGDGGRGSN